jgi:hypothetical protein
MAEVKNEIQVTKEYKMFQFIKGNRPIVKSKVTGLIKSYKSGLNLFPYCPIIINKDNYVVDGQHRLTACKELGLPFYYIVVPDVSLVQIAKINSVQSKWKQSDFFNCFIENGSKDYRILEMFKDKYSLPLNISACLLHNGNAQSSGTFSDVFQNGKFEVKQQDRANKILSAVFDFEGIVEDDSILRTKNFIVAIQLLLASEIYPHKEVIEKLKKNKSIIVRKDSHKEYIFHIEELYNKGNQKRYFIYQKPKASK